MQSTSRVVDLSHIRRPDHRETLSAAGGEKVSQRRGEEREEGGGREEGEGRRWRERGEGKKGGERREHSSSFTSFCELRKATSVWDTLIMTSCWPSVDRVWTECGQYINRILKEQASKPFTHLTYVSAPEHT